jgi:hypothetical protein
MAIRNQRQRFIIATLAATVVLIAAIFKLFGTGYFTFDFNGNLIPLYPHPFEVVVITLAVMLLLTLMYQWYKHDPIRHTVKRLNADERRQMLQLLLEEDQPQKRKRDTSHLQDADDFTFEEELRQQSHH